MAVWAMRAAVDSSAAYRSIKVVVRGCSLPISTLNGAKGEGASGRSVMRCRPHTVDAFPKQYSTKSAKSAALSSELRVTTHFVAAAAARAAAMGAPASWQRSRKSSKMAQRGEAYAYQVPLYGCRNSGLPRANRRSGGHGTGWMRRCIEVRAECQRGAATERGCKRVCAFTTKTVTLEIERRQGGRRVGQGRVSGRQTCWWGRERQWGRECRRAFCLHECRSASAPEGPPSARAPLALRSRSARTPPAAEMGEVRGLLDSLATKALPAVAVGIAHGTTEEEVVDGPTRAADTSRREGSVRPPWR